MTVRGWALLFVGAGFVWAEGCGGDTNGALFNGRGGHANAGAGGADAGETGGAAGSDSSSCRNSLDCVKAPGGRTVCDRAAGMCVECVADADCDAPTRCYAGHCRATCTSDKDCTRQGLLCDTQAGHCVECVVDGDCALRTTCVAGSCESKSPPGTGGTAASGGRAGGDGGNTGSGGVGTGGTRNSGGSIITSGGADAGGNANAGGSPSAGGNTNTGGMLASGGAAGAGGVGAGGAPPASCTDKKKDNAETDVDCGGGTCPPCQSTHSCKVGADCTSKSCSSGICADASCSDGIRNGTETSVDCGGGCLCRVNAACTMPSDCASGACSVNSSGSTGTCKPALTCSNGTRDGTETGVDCGGSGCNKCGATQACNSNIDCASFVCEGKVCAQCDAMKCPVPIIPLSTACCIANAGCGMSIAGTPCL